MAVKHHTPAGFWQEHPPLRVRTDCVAWLLLSEWSRSQLEARREGGCSVTVGAMAVPSALQPEGESGHGG